MLELSLAEGEELITPEGLILTLGLFDNDASVHPNKGKVESVLSMMVSLPLPLPI